MGNFSVADYSVFAMMLVVSGIIGIYYGYVKKAPSTTEGMFLAGKSMGLVPVAISIFGTAVSAIALLGIPYEIYTYGTSFYIVIGAKFLCIASTAHLYMPVFHKLGLITIFEYLEKRFSRLVRTLGSMAFSIQMILYMAVVLYAPSLALSQVTGIKVWTSVLSIGAVCTFYTTIGGIKAVIWTDVFQVLMMFAAMFTVVIKGTYDEGGIEKVWMENYNGSRIEFFNFDTNPTTRHTVWSLVIGGYFTWLAIYGVNQAMVQRYLSIPTLKGAQTAIWLNLPGLSLLLTITSLAGLIIYSKYRSCDPIQAGLVKAPDQLFPLFVMDTLGEWPGLPGLFVAGIFSGALSTVSSGVNSLAAVTLEDLIKAYFFPNMSELWATRVTKVLALTYGILSIALVAAAEKMGNVLQAALSLFGIFGGPLLGLFTLGMFFPWANKIGAAIGLLSGLGFSFWIWIGASFLSTIKHKKAPFRIDGCSAFNITVNATVPTTEEYIFPLYKLSYMWYSATGLAVVIVIGLIISFLTGYQKPSELDPRLFCPIFEKLCPYLPRSLLKKLRFGVREEEDVPPVTDDTTTVTPPYNVKFENGVANIGYVHSTSELTLNDKKLDKERESNANQPVNTIF